MKKRLFWLHINLVTAFMAAGVVAVFESMIAKLTILAVFLPVVAGQGGNAGAQSLAVVMRGIVMREIQRENRPADPQGGGPRGGERGGHRSGHGCGGLALERQSIPGPGHRPGHVFQSDFCRTFRGVHSPAHEKMGIDPAQSSSIILTTVTDILGFLAFLGFAVVFQSYLSDISTGQQKGFLYILLLSLTITCNYMEFIDGGI